MNTTTSGARRSVLLWSALAAAVAASLWAVLVPEDDAIEASAAPSPLALAGSAAQSLPASEAPVEAPPTAAAKERQGRAPRDDIFAAYSWEPPKPVIAAVKETPRAPPVPFTFSGRLEAEGAPSYILSEGGRMHVVAMGEQVGEFRLQQASAGSLVFLHVPTNLTATLSIAQ